MAAGVADGIIHLVAVGEEVDVGKGDGSAVTIQGVGDAEGASCEEATVGAVAVSSEALMYVWEHARIGRTRATIAQRMPVNLAADLIF